MNRDAEIIEEQIQWKKQENINDYRPNPRNQLGRNLNNSVKSNSEMYQVSRNGKQ